MIITLEQLKDITPSTSEEGLKTFLPHLNTYLPKYGIDTPIEVVSFLAQVLHESGGFKFMREIWGPTPAQLRYERDFSQPWPETIKGRRNWLATQLGNSFRGDGRKMAGVGPIQITGRFNLTRMSREMFGDLRLLQNPDILTTPEFGIQSACIYWTWRRLDRFDDDKSILEETIRVNGGKNGMVDRQKYFDRGLEVFGLNR